MIKFLNKSTQLMSAAFITGMLTSGSSKASTDFASMTEQVGGQANDLPQLISGVFYVCGAGTMGLGLFGVKNHVDAPSQNKLAPAVAKCAIGGALLATPAIGDMAAETITGGENDAAEFIDNDISIF